ncbi:uncharacterized protein BDR25DRAFT_357503 [Lindgomyces ingoldianus]|uniref:Uncharacterized protein n=1 Tax=Lindgomyces ingoldianus TaxID=673940 RepID=A0ACB6QNT7_9PLEO|nr:uncharacterized protein BDR25DRAFT_357503 [Lindgomyces ingoldianus]KAF2468571.1 hypothetical protein BDR25DRAFT_357503 [Lindgomyces ingoldianus]
MLNAKLNASREMACRTLSHNPRISQESKCCLDNIARLIVLRLEQTSSGQRNKAPAAIAKTEICIMVTLDSARPTMPMIELATVMGMKVKASIAITRRYQLEQVDLQVVILLLSIILLRAISILLLEVISIAYLHCLVAFVESLLLRSNVANRLHLWDFATGCDRHLMLEKSFRSDSSSCDPSLTASAAQAYTFEYTGSCFWDPLKPSRAERDGASAGIKDCSLVSQLSDRKRGRRALFKDNQNIRSGPDDIVSSNPRSATLLNRYAYMSVLISTELQEHNLIGDLWNEVCRAIGISLHSVIPSGLPTRRSTVRLGDFEACTSEILCAFVQ